MKKRQIDQKCFKQPVPGVDPITKGHFTIDWAFVSQGWIYNDFDNTSKDTLSAVGQITIDGYEPNTFYDALVKTPLLIQDHPLSVDFGNDIRFIKITNIGQWSSYGGKGIDKEVNGRKIELRNVEFEFLDNLDYLENILDFKNNNLL